MCARRSLAVASLYENCDKISYLSSTPQEVSNSTFSLSMKRSENWGIGLEVPTKLEYLDRQSSIQLILN